MTTLQTARPASIWKRIAAGTIDFAVLGMLVWPAVLLFGFGDVDVWIEFTRTSLGRWFPFLLFMGLWLFPYCLRDLVGGRSFGKWLLGIRVVDSTDAETTPDARRLILRNLTIWLSPIGLAAAGARADRMRFGDRLARTMVVEMPMPAQGPSWRETLLKAGCFAVVAVLCMSYWSRMQTRYEQGSRVYGRVLAYIDGCAEIRELTGGLSSDALRLMRFQYGPTADGAAVQLQFAAGTHGACPMLVVAMTRPADNVSAWTGHHVQLQLSPAPAAETVTGSRLNDAALAFLKTYAPLHEAVNDLHPEKFPLAGAVSFVEKGERKAAVWYLRPADRWAAQVQVLFERRDEAWAPSDAMGLVDLNIDNAPSRRMFVFVSGKNAHRYLTSEEMDQILRRGRPAMEVVPELRPEASEAAEKK